MNLIFQSATIRKEPLGIVITYGDLDDLKIMKYTKRKVIVFKNITTDLKDAITYLFKQLGLLFNISILQVEINLGDGHIQFIFKDEKKTYNSKVFAFSNTDKEIALGIRNVCKIAINQIRKGKGLQKKIFDNLFKVKLGVISVKDMQKRTNLTDTEIEKIQKNAYKSIDKLLKEKPYLYHKTT